ncbi:MAG: hypothetical protein KDD02_26565 [Phaeodactylibacter sp.]|nr:hypothetical protein [Phaeodactylibacter sp.]MCB9302656.1 hypothetical protein [Lewinellaceae bacterium]
MKTYKIQRGDSLEDIARRNYLVLGPEGKISPQKVKQVIKEIQSRNPVLKGSLPLEEEIILPEIKQIDYAPEIWIENPEDFETFATVISHRVNSATQYGILLLVDPPRLLEELGIHLSHEVKTELRCAFLGVTKSQMDQYDEIKERMSKGQRIPGFDSVRLRPCQESSLQGRPAEARLEVAHNPIGGFDSVLDLRENIVEKIVQVAYDEGVFPHRFKLWDEKTKQSSGEVVIGRPFQVTFDTPFPNGVKIGLPFALIQPEGNFKGEIVLTVDVTTAEIGGKPEYLTANFEAIHSIEVKDIPDDLKGLVELFAKTELKKAFGTKGKQVPLSPLVKEFSKHELYIEDFEFKVFKNQKAQSPRSLLTCLDFNPNNDAGKVNQVTQFLTQDWALGLNERILKQKFNDFWYKSPDAYKYHRISKDKLEDFMDKLEKESDKEFPNTDFLRQELAGVFNPNGDIYLKNVNFSLHAGYIAFNVELTVEDAIWFLKVDMGLSGKIKLAVDPQTNGLKLSVFDIDSSISCWSKFLIGLFFAFIGLIAGGIIGWIIGGVVGGVVGAITGSIIAATIGSALAGLVTGVIIPAIVEAALEGKLNSITDKNLLKMEYEWQIPNTTLILKVYGKAITILEGEALLLGTVTLPPLSEANVSFTKQLKTSNKTLTLPGASQSQLKKLGGSPAYLVTTQILLTALPDSGLENPITYHWSLDGQTLECESDKILITVMPSMSYCLKPASLSLGTVNSQKGQAKFDSEPCVQVQKIVRQVKPDGTVEAPRLSLPKKADDSIQVALIPIEQVGEATPTVAYPIANMVFDHFTVEVKAKDVLGTLVTKSEKMAVKVLGDKMYDDWQKIKGQYKQYVPLEELVSPGEELINPPYEDLLTPVYEKMEFQRNELAVNIEGTKGLD